MTPTISVSSYVALLWLLYRAAVVYYRLYRHRLAKFPGPKWTAATHLYEAYFDLLKRLGGQFMFEIHRMHEIYGPVVRINPDEIHIQDAGWATTLYVNVGQGKRDKHPPAAQMAGTPLGSFGTIPHDLHRKRRSAVIPFFSQRAVVAAEPMIREHAELFCQWLRRQIDTKGHAELRLSYLALTTDSLCAHMFAQPMGLLTDERLAINWHETIKAVAENTPLVKKATWIIPLAMRLPLTMLEWLSPPFARIVSLRRSLLQQAIRAVQSHALSEKGNSGDHSHNGTADDQDDERMIKSKTIFESLLQSKVLDQNEKEPGRISQEAFVVLSAGGETVGRVLANATYYILADRKAIMEPLLVELKQLMPHANSEPSLTALQQLPLLSAIIKESLRITGLISSRLPVVPDAPLRYKGWIIPAGAPTSLTLQDILLDVDVYEEPLTFRPERWFAANSPTPEMIRNYLPFSRGSRACIGGNFALAELHITLAYVFRTMDLELFDTVPERDIDIVRDCFVGEPSPDTKGIRVRFRSS